MIFVGLAPLPIETVALDGVGRTASLVTAAAMDLLALPNVSTTADRNNVETAYLIQSDRCPETQRRLRIRRRQGKQTL